MTESQHPARRLYETLKADTTDIGEPWVVADDESDLTDVTVDGRFNLEAAASAVYPYPAGDHTIIGPECFTDRGEFISYKGQNYKLQPDTDASTRTLDFELNITADTGVMVPCKFIIEYPDGHGFYAVKALQQLAPDHLNPLWNELIHRQDAATLRVMLESGHMRGDDDGS